MPEAYKVQQNQNPLHLINAVSWNLNLLLWSANLPKSIIFEKILHFAVASRCSLRSLRLRFHYGSATLSALSSFVAICQPRSRRHQGSRSAVDRRDEVQV